MKTRLLSAALSLALCLAAPVRAEHPTVRGDLHLPNLGLAKLEIKAYIDSGQYQKEFDQVVESAKAYLQENSKRHRGSNPAIVLDIDETSISNLPYLLEADFGYTPGPWQAWVQGDRAKAFPATLEFYQWARSQGISVFFITARPETDREATLKLLERTGFSDISGLYLKPVDDKASSAVYKAGQRRKIIEKGHHIVVNLGDQWTDLDGGYSEAEFKLPNPFYFVP